MLKTYCAATNLKTLLQQHSDMPCVQPLIKLIDRTTQDRSGDPLAGTPSSRVAIKKSRLRKCPELSKEAFNIIAKLYQEFYNRKMSPSVLTSVASHIINSLSYRVRTASERDSTIFFRTEQGDNQPAVIQFLVQVDKDKPESRVLYLVKRIAPLPAGVEDPFKSYPVEFGCSLWSNKEVPALEAISEFQVLCHAIWRPWVKGINVYRPLDRAGLITTL